MVRADPGSQAMQPRPGQGKEPERLYHVPVPNQIYIHRLLITGRYFPLASKVWLDDKATGYEP